MPPIGLVNQGNTCYFNALLQCLAHTGPLREWLLHHMFKPNLDENITREANKQGQETSSDEMKIAYGNSIVVQVYNVVKALWEIDSDDYAITPKNLKMLFGRKKRSMAGFAQQDDHEAIIFLLDLMHEETARIERVRFQNMNPAVLQILQARDECLRDIKENGLTGDEERERVNQYNQFKMRPENRMGLTTLRSYNAKKNWVKRDGQSGISQIFGTWLHSRITCPDCNHCSDTFDFSNHLILTMPQQRNLTLHDCLQHFTESETLDNDNRWNCDGCKTKVNGVKTFSVWEAPMCLIITLGRFEKHGRRLTKNTDLVEFPMELNMTPYLSDQNIDGGHAVYNLYGVCNHVGSLNGGHHYAYCKVKGIWYELNDSHTSEIAESQVCTDNAYMLFYQRV